MDVDLAVEDRKKKVLHQIGDYKLGKTLGKGSMGKVKVAMKDGVKYACKIIKRPIPDETAALREFVYMSDDIIALDHDLTTENLDDRRLIREMALTLLLDHPYIVTVHRAFVSSHYYYIIMDVMQFYVACQRNTCAGLYNFAWSIKGEVCHEFVCAIDFCSRYS
jgi:serine/threonine protein kinase